ncbi:MAG: KH domain-containing protein [Acidimicrobiales bacterium]|nr:KH domain-containing protein [Acidimicrobiales bacterium]
MSDAPQAPTAHAVLEHVVKSIVDRPDDVAIDVVDKNGTVGLNVTVSGDDMGRVIGKRGRVATAIRTLVRAAATKDGCDVDVDFLD